MKFTNGFWQTRTGVRPLFAQEAYDFAAGQNSLTVTAPTKVIEGRGDTVSRPTLTVTLSSPQSFFPVEVGYTAFAPLPPAFFTDPATFGKKPIGNGPFQITAGAVK